MRKILYVIEAYKPEPGRKVAGSTWRLLAHTGHDDIDISNRGVFDELVVDDWLHIEQMDEHCWWMRVGDAEVNVFVREDGGVRVTVERGKYGGVR